MTNKRSSAIASISNLLAPGLGFLYLGKPVYAFLLPLVLSFLLPAAVSWSNLIFHPIGASVFIIGAASGILFGALSAGVMARRSRCIELKFYQRWYVYAGFVITFLFLNTFISDNRASIFGVSSYRVSDESMSGTLKVGDLIFAKALDSDSERPLRGDVVVHSWPGFAQPNYISRVIGLPGDTVESIDGQLLINGRLFKEKYVLEKNKGTARSRNFSFKVPAESYLVLGDNRDNSADSRVRGFIARGDISERVRIIWISFSPTSGLDKERFGKLVN